MSTVVLIGCSSYKTDTVYAAVRAGIELLGGTAAFVKAGEKILLKPNMLAARAPELAVTTHPAVFEAAARIFQEAGAILSYGDSPGYDRPAHAARVAGIAEIAEKLGVSVADFETAAPAQVAEAAGAPVSFPIAKGVREADGLISLCKMKTHSLTRITGALKNQLGCLTGFEKARLHVRNPNPQKFSSRLALITKIVNPRLYIMDGVTAMEGEGPSGGNPVGMGVLLFSRDPVALDAVFCRLIDLDPAYVPTIAEGQALGLGTKDGVTLVGDPAENFVKPDFDVVRKPVTGDILFRPLRPLKNSIIPRPVIAAAKCEKCGVCVRACPAEPVKALAFPGGGRAAAPVYDYSRCIRCYCCQEMCPHRAVSVKTPLFGRIITRLLGKF
ncbi:MAG: DUF362 domain-containing protein [Spirochaetales bacterium]|jgi:uncharacterized protein (DUF362 family)/ferredoxin|nr:DUF362 domain-containing protein [Spirochaetales bacterium]